MMLQVSCSFVVMMQCMTGVLLTGAALVHHVNANIGSASHAECSTGELPTKAALIHASWPQKSLVNLSTKLPLNGYPRGLSLYGGSIAATVPLCLMSVTIITHRQGKVNLTSQYKDNLSAVKRSLQFALLIRTYVWGRSNAWHAYRKGQCVFVVGVRRGHSAFNNGIYKTDMPTLSSIPTEGYGLHS